MGFLKEFRTFIARGNVIDLAVGIVIGAAFTAIVKSFVDDILMPPVGLLLGGVDFRDLFVVLREGATAAGPYATLADAKAAGAVTVNYGLFLNAIIAFVIVAFAVFLLVRQVNRLKEKPAAADPTTKECPHCASVIPLKAKKCGHCTSAL